MQPSLCRWNTERERNTVDIISRMVAKLKPRAVIPWEHVFLPTVYLLFLLRRPANSFSFHMCWKMETWTCLWHLHNTDECVFMSIFFQHRMFPHFLFFFFFCTIFHFVPVINVRGMKFYSSLPWPCWCYADIFVRIKHYVSLSQAVASCWEYFWEPFLQFSVLSFSPFLIVVISQSSFPSFNTALLSSGMEMRHFVAPCQRATDWTLAWMVQQMFADCLIHLFI